MVHLPLLLSFSKNDTSMWNVPCCNAYKYHSNSPENGINIYSFSLNPENRQPHGSCNFSKIDDIVLELNVSNKINYNNPAVIRIYNFAYNVFRIVNGLGGLVFSN